MPAYQSRFLTTHTRTAFYPSLVCAALMLAGCDGQVFVWTVRDIVGLSFLGLIVGVFLLYWAVIYALAVCWWAVKRVKRLFKPMCGRVGE